MSKEPILTPWFPCDVKPVREGVYEKDFFGGSSFQYWDGTRWHYGASTQQATADLWHRFIGASPSPRRWRGLAEEPK